MCGDTIIKFGNLNLKSYLPTSGGCEPPILDIWRFVFSCFSERQGPTRHADQLNSTRNLHTLVWDGPLV